MILLVTGASVAIERAIEVLWTLIGNMKGSVWPLNLVSKQVTWLTVTPTAASRRSTTMHMPSWSI